MDDWMLTEKQAELVAENTRLITSTIARMLSGMCEKWNYDDMWSYGAVGLCKAARDYDEKKGKFSTVACKYIKNEILYEFRKMNQVKRGRHYSFLSLNYDYSGEGYTLSDVIPDKENVESRYNELQIIEYINEQKKKRRDILVRRAFGCNDYVIAEELGILPQSVSQTRKRCREEIDNKFN